MLAGIGLIRAADTYIKPMVPGSYYPADGVGTGRWSTLRIIWTVALGVVSFMLVAWVGKFLGIAPLKKKV